jgi:hypothetical protein
MHSAAEPRSLPVGSGTLAATLVLAPPLAGLLWLSGTVALPVAFGAMTLFVFVMSAGFLLLRAAHAADMPAPAAWVLGIFATAIAVYAATRCCRPRAGKAGLTCSPCPFYSTSSIEIPRAASKSSISTR